MFNTLVRLPDRIALRAAEEASTLGLSMEELIVLAVQEYIDDPLDGRVRLLAEVAAFIDRTYSPESFPPDVMLRVFQHIRRNPELHDVYYAETHDDEGHLEPHARAHLNRQIRCLVACRLDAETIGEPEQLDPEFSLTDSWARLRPTQ
jgi:hypothetical protein